MAKTASRSAVGALLLLAVAPASPAGAQGFDAERFVPAAGANSDLTVESPVAIDHLEIGFGFLLNYADDALVFRDTDTDDIIARPLDNSLTADLIASLGLFKIAEVGLHLPVHVVYDGDNYVAGGQTLSAGGGAGDLRLVPKLTLLGTGDEESHFVLGLGMPVSFPTGDAEAFRGADGVTLTPLLMALAQIGRLGISANLGFIWRQEEPAQLPWGHELRTALALSYEVSPDSLDLLAELTGGKQVSTEGDGPEFGLEALLGIGYDATESWRLYAGGGVGVAKGLGTPDFRLLAGVRFATSRPQRNGFADSDGDGIADRDDDCASEAEDADGYLDEDGCPEPDNDGDGIADEDDECPELPEDDEDGDGCPSRTHVTIEEGEMVIFGKVQFETGSDRVSPKSEQLLDQIAVAVNGHPEVGNIRIEGHTDNVGDDALNEKLSKKRAKSVKAELVKRGVDEDRLETDGLGEAQPLAPNDTAAGRAKNRRVEFKIVEGDR